MKNKIKELYVNSPILLEAYQSERLSMDNKLRFEYEIENEKGVYRALISEDEFLNPILRLHTSFLYKVSFKMKKKRKYIIKLLCFAAKNHTRTKTKSGILSLALKREIDKDRTWLQKREAKYPDIKLSVQEAARIWWNG
jgi:hypothetical protein